MAARPARLGQGHKEVLSLGLFLECATVGAILVRPFARFWIGYKYGLGGYFPGRKPF